MKKILILSYHFPPMNVIASQRALGYANHFKQFGFEPTILTFDWSKKIDAQYCSKNEFESKVVVEKYEDYEVIKIPVVRNKFLSWLDRKEGSFIYKVWILWSYFMGHLDVKPRLLEAARSERYYLNNYIDWSQYQVLLGVFSPHYHLKNCFLISDKMGIPYVLDFRDLWDNRIVDDGYSPSRADRVRDFFVRKFWNKFSSRAILLSIIGEVWVEELKSVTQKDEVISVYNGFENEIGEVEGDVNEDFVISYTGTLYEWQEYELMVKGLKKFLTSLSEVDLKKLRINFIGTYKKQGSTEVIDFIRAELKDYNISLTGRISKEETIAYQRLSNVLLFPTAPQVKGFYSGKIFEYISSGSLILAGPEDHLAVANLIRKTKTGEIYQTEMELCQKLHEAYFAWQTKNESSLVNRDVERIQFYSRKSQTRFMAENIQRALERN